MVPKLVSKGRSFKGAAAYLLHDKGGAQSAERVAWTETRNLATENPELAWRVMVATALDQDRLKAAAGVKSSGRKSDQPVLHVVLSWHPEEREGLTQDEMRRAAIGALKAIGAEERQVLLIAHNDEEHAHLHLLCNRVSPEDGRMLSSSNDRLKLSKWAQGYELERGKVYCENRVVNNERRAQGEFVADQSALPYHQASGPESKLDSDSRAQAVLRETQRAKDRALAEHGAAQAAAQRAQWLGLADRFEQRKRSIREEARRTVSQARNRIGTAYHPLRLSQNEAHTAARAAFEEREGRLFGRISNAMKALDHLREMRGDSTGAGIGEGFRVLASAGARREALQKAQEREKAALNRAQTLELAEARRTAMSKARSERRIAEIEFASARALLTDRQRLESEALKVAWKERTKDRAVAWSAFAAAQDGAPDLRQTFAQAADGPSPKRRKDDDGGFGTFLKDMQERYGSVSDSESEHEHDRGDDYER
jgi:hypothetical protein